jgi:hypothetical protein
MRLASDCRQLARDVQHPDLLAHFEAMAKLWANSAECGFDADTNTMN